VAQEVSQAVPSDLFAAEIAAISFERLGVKNRALGFYEKLYLDDTNDLNTLYKMAFLQNDLKLFEEATNSTDLLLANPKAKELKLVFPTADGKGQEATMELAVLRLKGMIASNKGDKDKAKEFYNQVLKVSPNFELVKQQLADLAK
jgi:tetratricopeptide (TPR) repeat protein